MSTSPAGASGMRRASSLDTLSSIRSSWSNLPQYSPFDSSIPSLLRTESEGSAEGIVSGTESGTARRFEPSFPDRYSRILDSSLSLPTAGPDDGPPKEVVHIEHAFPIKTNKPWATLLTFTSSSIAGLATDGRVRKIPHFVGNEMVTGMVELDLESTQTVQEISVTIKGKLITGHLVDEAYTFLDHKHVVWNTKDMGRPPTCSKHLGEYQDQRKNAPDKLLGSYQIPFTFPFPSLINFDSYKLVVPDGISPFSLASLSSATPPDPQSSWTEIDRQNPVDPRVRLPLFPHYAKRNKCLYGRHSFLYEYSARMDSRRNNDTICTAPPTFVEPGITASIRYELIAHIVHGFLKPDSRIKTTVAYTPFVVPPQLPSIRRKESYATKNIAPGPLIDPSGWFALPKVTIKGRVGGPNGRDISVLCQLYLATPLTYTRDTFIPCYLSLSGDDPEAVNTLTSLNTPCVRLVRRVRHWCPKGRDPIFERNYAENTTSNPEFYMTLAWSASLPAVAGPSGKGTFLKTVLTDMGGAVWWKPPKDVPSEPYTSHLQGEIHLPVNIHPSCNSPLFQIEYFVEMQPPVAAAFEFKDKNYGKEVGRPVLVSYPVRIATFHSCDGVVPIAFTQPLKRRR